MPQARPGWLASTGVIGARTPLIALGAVFSLFLLYATWQRYPSYHRQSTELIQGTLDSSLRLSSARQKFLQSINNATLGFEKILAISLPERTDHHDGLVLASAVSNIEIHFVDGVLGNTVTDKVLPPIHDEGMNDGSKGAWRAHMNAISLVVERGWSTVFIVEDDVDWDLRLRDQLHNFALGSDWLLRDYFANEEVSAQMTEHSVTHSYSPYGDDWDVLWLGHCGSAISNTPRTMLFENDATCPQNSKIGSFDNRQRQFMQKYPPHTRIITKVTDTTCSLGYAVSQRGARALLYQLGLQKLNGPFDTMLRDFCEGKSDRGEHKCVTVMPQLFDHHRRAISPAFDSDISFHSGDVRDKAFTKNVRWSVRMNMDKILKGETDYNDQWPDD